MRGFAFLMALLGIFVFLLSHFSFWVVFGAMYMTGVLLVAIFAFFGKHQGTSQVLWHEAVEIKHVK